VQNSGVTTLIAITGTDTLTGVVTPTLSAYVAGQVFSFVVAATNTGAVTLNINSLGAQAVTRTGAVALVAGDMVTGQVAIVEYDGTRFQLLNGNSFTNLKASGTLGVTGVTTIAAGTALLPALTTTGDTNTGVWFPAADTIAASTGGTERIRVTSTGLFGIGCTPARQLSVQYPFAKTDTSNRAIAVFKSNDASNANEMLISSTGAATQASRVWNIQTGEDGVSNAGILSLQSSGGNVGIGTAAPTSLLHVSTSASRSGLTGGLINSINTNTGGSQSPVGYFESSSDSGYGAMYIYAKGSRSGASPAMQMVVDGTGSVYQIIFNNGNGAVGSISTSGSTTTYSTSSDYRLKNTIRPMTGALNKVALLKPVTYKWNADGSGGQGFIAHELQEIIPDCVTGEKDATKEGESGVVPIYQGVDTSYLVATLTAAIQELKAIIDTQAARITALENT
jgi:hypothetical protein